MKFNLLNYVFNRLLLDTDWPIIVLCWAVLCFVHITMARLHVQRHKQWIDPSIGNEESINEYRLKRDLICLIKIRDKFQVRCICPYFNGCSTNVFVDYCYFNKSLWFWHWSRMHICTFSITIRLGQHSLMQIFIIP